ncbi:inactive peptidyl-prolyl cis-trans isomerase FKBP6-like [Homarus americanus]|uniref:inactive peptidyl-prolyl cis-trans isomerase FKBP6-like n=1 Tax=Homarus americanus TaxID=6706 RepID=UPI001C4975F6|nr:inactive peptidyl-prolyl cis-trans isomerase FKBP6-like [Homarus americanus]XP_042211192.1 inactive peptidyl-prolyl cis-trans isomerase FKBP6-like [Homarus americanus]XP_042211193.1 inactive peptidyl-prolyl cis-trans isomerase FKBP6-like [Homarus americanus]XP_042211194.1 inactive peptidyl-prolyl cis-trans isomerase FKBP6-like [Homarus americanus]XP_042211195.1 inactive peptidyl-prolyl cis-trans isomerase FKBP6-like [Homarus americanus]XP_042211197.1 inactive peptidyl-prolyl cis-trans isome
MDEKKSKMSQADGAAANYQDDIELNSRPVKLTEALNLNDVYSETGTVFEISEQQEHAEDCTDKEENIFEDETLINSLTLGAGNAVFGEDEEEASSSDETLEPFEKLARKMEDMTGDGGVLKMEVRPGIGGGIPSGAAVTFHYSAYLQYCDEPFDSSYLRMKPEKQILDFRGLLPGLNVAIKTMRKNEKARFLISPEYAFGEMGCQPRIPSNETILYEIDVLYFVDCAAADAYSGLNEQEQCVATFKEKLEAARGLHRKGNEQYHERNLKAAKSSYTRAAWILEDAKLNNEKEETQRNSVLFKMRNNLAQVYLDMKEPAKACTQCKLGFNVSEEQSNEVKAKLYFRFGKAKAMLHDFKSARKLFLKAQHLKPNNEDISTELEKLLHNELRYEAQEKIMYQRMFRYPEGNTQKNHQEKSVKAKETKNQNINNAAVLPGVHPEFERIVEKQIMQFAVDPNVRVLSFPSNLSQEEIACVSAAATAVNCIVSVSHIGAATYLKVMKSQ